MLETPLNLSGIGVWKIQGYSPGDDRFGESLRSTGLLLMRF